MVSALLPFYRGSTQFSEYSDAFLPGVFACLLAAAVVSLASPGRSEPVGGSVRGGRRPDRIRPSLQVGVPFDTGMLTVVDTPRTIVLVEGVSSSREPCTTCWLRAPTC